MAQRRPITTHPAFAPFLALWFAALFGMGVSVLPAPLLERMLEATGLGALVPVPPSARLTASGAAALLGALLGLTLALALGRRARRDPRPIYAEDELPIEDVVFDEPIRRPLRVREELEDAEPETSNEEKMGDPAPPLTAKPDPRMAEADEGFMILTPQPVHPLRPAPDLQGLLDQFDTALATFRSGEDLPPAQRDRDPDPVRAFVARQTGGPAPSPLGGQMPDHQAELRAALDKLARAHHQD